MSEVNAADLTRINSADDIFDMYAGSGDQAKSGIEVELPFFDPSSADLPVMDLERNNELRNNALNALADGFWVHNEPTSDLLEVTSRAATFANAKDVLEDIQKKIGILTQEAKNLGLKRSYFQELPERTADDLLSRIVELDRYKGMYVPYRDDMKKCVQYFAVCKSNQISVSPYTMDHMLDNVRRLYILAPFLFLLTDNSTGFSEGKPFSGHAGMYLRHEGLQQGRGGVPPYIFTAASGEELIASHIDHVFNNPLFMYYDCEGNLVRVPSGDWSVTFNTLKEKGRNIASNYYLSQSILWPDVKIAALRNDEEGGTVYGHRFEARMFGVGVHQHQTAFIITSALAFHESFAVAVDGLLERYGFSDNDLKQTHDRVLKSYKNAREHNGKFFDIAYGTGQMTNFAKEFADLAEKMADATGLSKEIQPLLTICRTGCTDAKVNRSLFPQLSDILDQQRNYDPAIFTDPNQCAHNIYAKEIAAISDGLCAAA